MEIERLLAHAHHRNGVGGVPFRVALFQYGGRTMVAVQFPHPDAVDSSWGYDYTAVLDVDLLTDGDIAFGSNSWRGPRFGNELNMLIARKERLQGGTTG